MSLTPETLHSSLEEMAFYASADAADAGAAARRAATELADIEKIIAQCRAADFPPGHVELVEALLEPTRAVLKAAEAAVVAAEARLVLVSVAADMAVMHLQLQASNMVAGGFYRRPAGAPVPTVVELATAFGVDVEDERMASVDTVRLSADVGSEVWDRLRGHVQNDHYYRRRDLLVAIEMRDRLGADNPEFHAWVAARARHERARLAQQRVFQQEREETAERVRTRRTAAARHRHAQEMTEDPVIRRATVGGRRMRVEVHPAGTLGDGRVVVVARRQVRRRLHEKKVSV